MLFRFLLIIIFGIIANTPLFIRAVVNGDPVKQNVMLRQVFVYIIAPVFITVVLLWFISKRKKISIKNLAGKSVFKRYNLKIYFPILILAIGRIVLGDYISLYQFNISEIESEVNIFLNLISLVILHPITEEIIYRGIILRGLLSKYKPWLAIAVSSVFFSIIHFTIPRIELAFISGITYGIIYYMSCSLLLTTTLHSVVNFIVALKLYNIIQYQTEWWFGILGVALIILGYYLFTKFIKSSKKQYG